MTTTCRGARWASLIRRKRAECAHYEIDAHPRAARRVLVQLIVKQGQSPTRRERRKGHTEEEAMAIKDEEEEACEAYNRMGRAGRESGDERLETERME